MRTVQLSRNTLLFGVQSIANVLLAFWLYMEYLHNPFLREYVSNVWASIWPAVTVSISALVAAVALIAVYTRKRQLSLAGVSGRGELTEEMGNGGGLAVLDTCPFCNVPLKVLSEGRFQCRKCRRYFKK